MGGGPWFFLKTKRPIAIQEHCRYQWVCGIPLLRKQPLFKLFHPNEVFFWISCLDVCSFYCDSNIFSAFLVNARKRSSIRGTLPYWYYPPILRAFPTVSKMFLFCLVTSCWLLSNSIDFWVLFSLNSATVGQSSLNRPNSNGKFVILGNLSTGNFWCW